MIVQRHTHINEWLVYGLLAALLILLALLGMLLVRFLWPAPARYDLGTVAALRARAPQRRDLADGLVVYLVDLDGELVAWDALPPLPNGCGPLRWVASNNRFEEPCVGGKWCADGSIADVRFPDARTLTRYALAIEDGHVYLNPQRREEGEPLAAAWRRSWPPDWMPPDELYYCRQLRQ
ncbi:MAG: hypothetical protein IAE81_17470 [Caldilineaceae bacterium]|jgi:hypothetical protein|nr:hypothetical protein [Caldilineaceae bacterium]